MTQELDVIFYQIDKLIDVRNSKVDNRHNEKASRSKDFIKIQLSIYRVIQ